MVGYTGTIVSEAEMQFMAGELRDATGDVEANHNFLAFYAEAYLCALVKYDIVTNWASLSTKFKPLFTEWAARMAGCDLIRYNTAGYANELIEAEDMITFNVYRMQQIEKILSSQDINDFLGT